MIYGKIRKFFFTGEIKLIMSAKSHKIESNHHSAYYDENKKAIPSVKSFFLMA